MPAPAACHNNQNPYHSRNERYAPASDQACPSCRHDRRQVTRAEGRSVRACEMMGFDPTVSIPHAVGQTVLPSPGSVSVLGAKQQQLPRGLRGSEEHPGRHQQTLPTHRQVFEPSN